MKRIALFVAVALLVVVVGISGAVTPGPTPEKVLNKDVAKLVAALNNDNLEKRAAAAEKLGEKCCKDAVPYLVKMMKEDQVSSARIVAANALAKIGDYSVIPAMVEQAKQDKNKTVRYALGAIAKQMAQNKEESSS
ncbi:HEAT repeat domain-containing protein [candidate division KSB1 bacterium]|nr:HEAT repeat domain-containing protein [candidate division KSB1 bacterium]